ncbi:MAG: hypothetical protein KBC17_03250 [Candidatus Pacebacteria bacterium]|nr:hypothetical protein [Candidatus Paceibacterota bacterium]
MQKPIKYFVIDKTAANLEKMLGVNYVLAEKLEDAEIVFIRTKTSFKTDEDFARIPSCKIIALLATNPKKISVAEATKRGILVFYAKGANALSVARTAMMYIESVLHNIFSARKATQECEITEETQNELEVRKNEFIGDVFHEGQTILIIGFGDIGKLVAEIALFCGMKVYVNDLDSQLDSLTDNRVTPVYDDQIKHIIHECDFITSHTSGEEVKCTHEIIARAKHGSIWADLARGDSFDLSAMCTFIPDRNLRFITDFCSVPALIMQKAMPESVYCFPHLGATTLYANFKCADMITKAILSFRGTNTLGPFCLNPQAVEMTST